MRFQQKLNKSQMKNAAGRTENALNIYQAESNHLIQEVNQNFKAAMIEFLNYWWGFGYAGFVRNTT